MSVISQLFVALNIIVFLCFENAEPASLGAIAQNIHSDLLLLDANLASNPNLSRDGRRINLNKFAVPSGNTMQLAHERAIKQFIFRENYIYSQRLRAQNLEQRKQFSQLLCFYMAYIYFLLPNNEMKEEQKSLLSLIKATIQIK